MVVISYDIPRFGFIRAWATALMISSGVSFRYARTRYVTRRSRSRRMLTTVGSSTGFPSVGCASDGNAASAADAGKDRGAGQAPTSDRAALRVAHRSMPLTRCHSFACSLHGRLARSGASSMPGCAPSSAGLQRRQSSQCAARAHPGSFFCGRPVRARRTLSSFTDYRTADQLIRTVGRICAGAPYPRGPTTRRHDRPDWYRLCAALPARRCIAGRKRERGTDYPTRRTDSRSAFAHGPLQVRVGNPPVGGHQSRNVT